MSVLKKKWLVINHSKDKPAIEKVLKNRGLNDIEEGVMLHDPMLFSQMEKALSRIKKAIESRERIIIFGDYDVDGISATALLFRALKSLKANVSFRLPNRMEDGYGLSEKFIKEFLEIEVGLVITVDCGISCGGVITFAKKNGIDVIITDHHTIPEIIPEDAYAILHPKIDANYPFGDLTGAGVAFKLASALVENSEAFLDLAALGTIADLGHIRGENRYIVKKGLEVLAKTKWIGLRKLIELAELKDDSKIDTYAVGYRIAPRINAAGRIGDPYLALSLLIQEDNHEKTHSLGEELQKLNKERQDMTFTFQAEAEQFFAGKDPLPPILIAENVNWHIGILGLIAGKITEKYARPSIILQDFGDTLVGSCRSPSFFSIVDALKENSRYLLNFGGHNQAAGFNIKKENYEDFKKAITKTAEAKLANQDLIPVLPIDCEISEEEINFDLLDKLEELEPFGVGNEKPVFLINNVHAHFVEKVGKERTHLKFSLQLKDNSVSVIGFNLGEYAGKIKEGGNINLVFRVERHCFNNKNYLNLHAIDFDGVGE